MAKATPVYSNGTWGSVVAVIYNGETITPETVGEVIYENREVTHTKDGCYPVTQTLTVAFQSIKPWDVLEAAGLLPDLMPIPEPEEVREAREAAERRLTRLIAPYDFQNRFTDAELVAIQTSADPVLIRARTKIQTIITHVDLDELETQQLVGYLQLLKIVTPERAAEILA
jgi:hypothetical protein